MKKIILGALAALTVMAGAASAATVHYKNNTTAVLELELFDKNGAHIESFDLSPGFTHSWTQDGGQVVSSTHGVFWSPTVTSYVHDTLHTDIWIDGFHDYIGGTTTYR